MSYGRNLEKESIGWSSGGFEEGLESLSAWDSAGIVDVWSVLTLASFIKEHSIQNVSIKQGS